LEDGSAGREAAEAMRRAKEAELEEIKVRRTEPCDGQRDRAADAPSWPWVVSPMPHAQNRLNREKIELQSSFDAERKRLKAQIAELQEQLDEQTALVSKLRRDLEAVTAERDELESALESAERAKAAAEKANRKLTKDLKEAQTAQAEEASKARCVCPSFCFCCEFFFEALRCMLTCMAARPLGAAAVRFGPGFWRRRSGPCRTSSRRCRRD